MVSDLIVAAKRDISKMFRRLPQQRAKPKPKPKPKPKLLSRALLGAQLGMLHMDEFMPLDILARGNSGNFFEDAIE